MKTILVPTDFSNNAMVAARYAIGFAERHGYNVHFLHAYSSFVSAFQSKLANETDENRARLSAKKDMVTFKESIMDNGAVPMSYGISKGNLIDSLKEYIDENPVSLIIMGTSGDSGTRKDIIGSNTYDVATTIFMPLLVVPENITDFQLNNIIYFTDFQKNDAKTLLTVKNITPNKDEPCILVHIAEQGNSTDEMKNQKLQKWRLFLQEETGYENLTSLLVMEKENINTIHQVINQLNGDLTVLTLVGGRGFFEKLIYKSLARAIVLNPKTPVLLYTGTGTE